MTLYALRHTRSKKLVGVLVSGNDPEADFCGTTSTILDTDSSAVWVTENLDIAVRVSETSTEWYNSDHYHPENPYIGKLEVVTFAELA